MTWAAVAIGGASLISGVIGANAAGSAASQQAAAAQNAQNIGLQEFNTITGQQQPFMNAGYGALGQLNYLLGQGTPGTGGARGTASSSSAGGYGSLLSPFTAQTMAEYSPAYNFQMQQGRQGVLNGDAAGTGVLSGAAQKDLMGYNQNFANTAFNNAFNQYQAQQGNIYSRLSGVANLGQNAAANVGQQGTALAGQQAQAAQNVGTALAGGTVGAANAYSSALQGASYAPFLATLYGNSPQTNSGGGAP
jgi:enamine deaminase RidA (YjgF/YER057c/UK114 family)